VQVLKKEKGALATSIKERKEEKKSKNEIHRFGPCWE